MLSRSHDSIYRGPPMTSWRHASASLDPPSARYENLKTCFGDKEGVRVTVNHHYGTHLSQISHYVFFIVLQDSCRIIRRLRIYRSIGWEAKVNLKS